ncbi:MmgE/PrpD family protein [Hyphomonas sp. FCG-A18]|uniref:MmgE/PrpD family protein n=1 Tax=Hyphomonas sp. FCG-A18 TaxID=3080019 RepID=UPI002B2CCA77|nr:MmgE/PrpD family protein [Hyphomonas sp. FCG-A18]
MSGQIANPTLLQRLASYLARPVDTGAQARANLHLLDWVGCAIAGAVEPAGKMLKQAKPAGPSGEAFYWGGIGNILEMDDVDKRALLHPGPSIIPAALVCADEAGQSGEALIKGIVHGYEATIRLGRAVGTGHYALWHSTGTCGPIGAAAACASLLGLDDTQTAHALALAMSQASGLWQTRHEPASMGKQLHTAHAARAGYEAARLAKAGFTGPLTILEGEQGFFAATCPGADPADILATYESDWLIHDVSFKPWPACRHAHAVIDAALALSKQTDMSGPIEVRTYGDALKFCDKPNPQTVIEAKFSLQHAVAVCVVRGEPQLEDFLPGAIEDPAMKAVRARVNVAEAEPYASAYPARFGGEVSANGVTAKAPDALGDPENPVSAQQIEGKALTLMKAGGMEDDAATNLLALAKDPSKLPDLVGVLRGVLG